MSLACIPWWVYDLEYQYHLAKQSGCMESEWVPEWSIAIDAYNYRNLTYFKYDNSTTYN
jgi:hypothetical protein